jgi:hypothetical protein
MTPVLHTGGGMLTPHDVELFQNLGREDINDINTINIEKLRNFVLSRRGSDGGFTFCKPLPSSLPETYYAVYVLKSIDAEIPDRGALVDFLYGSIREEVYAIFYTLSCLTLLEERLPDFSGFLLERLEEILQRLEPPSQEPSQTMRVMDYGGTTATYSFNMPSILREVYTITSSLRLLRKSIPDEVRDFVERFRKGGGFGIGSPNLQETHYCLFVLNRGGENIIAFIGQHECPAGGFTKSPGSYPPYLEETYHALSSLKLLEFRYSGNEVQKIHKIQKYIASLQNPNGGFRRSIYGGISTLEDSYYAVASLRIVKEMAGDG